MLLDTTILVDYLRGRQEARNLIEALSGKFSASVASVLELHAGVRNRREEQHTELLLSKAALFPVTLGEHELGGSARIPRAFLATDAIP